MRTALHSRVVQIPVAKATLTGDLALPANVRGMVLFAHGSGSSRHSSRNRFVANELHGAGLGTLLLDLLTEGEEAEDRVTMRLRFDIGLLADRLASAIDWLRAEPDTAGKNIGLFGASTGGGAAIVASVLRPGAVSAIVCRGGRPDLAGEALDEDLPPTLLLVGGLDEPVLSLNHQVFERLKSRHKLLEVVPQASHLFEEPGALEEVAVVARDWFSRFLWNGEAFLY